MFLKGGRMKHTKGPWKAYQTSGKTIIETKLHTLDSPRKYIAILEEGTDQDAKLIAAAPEMLEALELAHRTLLLSNKLQSAHEVELVIKKAKGES